MSVTDRACRSLMGLRSDMLFSDVACRGLRWVTNQACRSLMKHVEVLDGSPIRHVGLWCSMLRYLMSLRSGMAVSKKHVEVFDGSPIRNDGLQCSMLRSPIRHVIFWWSKSRSPIRHVGLWWRMSRSPMGLQSGRSVSYGSPIGLRWLSVNNNIFVNS